MLINLWVRNNFTGEVHQVGTNRHDSIEFIDGQPQYYNMQNGCGTLRHDDGGYSWVEPPDMDGYISITPEEMMLNEAYIDERLYRFLKNRPPETNTRERAKYNRRLFLAVKEIRKKIKGFFTIS